MTLSTQKSNFLINLPKFPPTAEEVLCWNIQKGNLKVVKECLKQGLDPNYFLEQEVIVNNTIFSKGSSLLFLVVYSSMFNNIWDSHDLLRLLLGMNANIEKSPGGGYESVLEFACANANLIGESILTLLLNSVSQERACLSLEKIVDPIKKENLRKSLLEKNSNPHYSDESVCNMLLEEHIFSIIVNGNEEQLKSLLDLGLDPDYTINQNLFVSGINFFSGSSLLLITLKICVEFSASEQLFGVLALLLERGVNLTLECGGISPLKYVCENYESLHPDVVLCLLTSETREQVNIALQSVLDENKRNKLEIQLNSVEAEAKFQYDLSDDSINLSIFNSELDRLVNEEVSNSFNIDYCLENNLNPIFNEDFNNSQEKNLLEGTSSQYAKTSEPSLLSMQMKSLPLVNLLEDVEELDRKLLFLKQYSVEFMDIIVSIVENKDFSILESALCNPEKLKKLNLDIQKLSSKDTFFSCLFKEIQDANIKHTICFLFIKHGFSPKDMVYQGKNMLSFVCNYRGSFLGGSLVDKRLLMQTIYFLCFLVKEDKLVKDAILNLRSNRDKELLESYFLIILKRSTFNVLEMLTSRYFNYELFKAYVECSILTRKDIITGESWDIDKLHQGKTCLSQIAISLCKSSSDVESLRTQKKQLCLLDLFSLLLKLGADPDKRISNKNLSARKIIEYSYRDPIIRENLLEKLKNFG